MEGRPVRRRGLGKRDPSRWLKCRPQHLWFQRPVACACPSTPRALLGVYPEEVFPLMLYKKACAET